MNIKNLAILIVSIILTACGSSINNSNNASGGVINGRFVDANVVGIEYQAGSAPKSITGANGSYVCNQGELVRFFLGPVILGSAECNSLITPISLIDNANAVVNADNQEVINIVRFLNYLDDGTDGEIVISDELRNAFNEPTNNIQNIEFNIPEDSFTTATLTTNITDLSQLSGNTLPTVAAAQEHITGTLRCVYSGIFAGQVRITNEQSEQETIHRLGIMINPADGKLSFVGFDTQIDPSYTSIIDITRTFSLDNERKINFTDGTLTVELEINNAADEISGYITRDGNESYILANRLAGPDSANSKYRLASRYYSTDTQGNETNNTKGFYSLNIDDNNAVTGFLHDPKGNFYSSITGTLATTEVLENGVRLRDLSFSPAIQGLGNITSSVDAKISLSTGAIQNRNWTSTASADGTIPALSGKFEGSLCQLN